LTPSVPAAEHPRLLRALDFHDTQPKEAALTALLEGDAIHNLATYLEAFQRATPKFLEKHPEVLKRVESAMLASKGTVTFVDMVARFNRKDMVKHLMDMVQTAPEKEPGIRAIQQIFSFKEDLRIAAALNKPNQTPALLKALGFVSNNEAVAMLRAVTTDEARLEASRLLAITALGRSSSGAGVLMQLVQQKKLPAKFMSPAIQSLAASPSPNTRSFAAQHQKLLMPAGKRWPIELLLTAKPNAHKGKAVFQKAGCIACHIVQGEGLDFGPELSDIGNKLSSEQLFEAILKPNQSISLGYEGVNIALKDGTQLIGFVTSESKTVLSLRIPGGLRKDVAKANIKTRAVMKDSLMPAGLDAVISPQELVDLVGWLSPQLPELLAASIHGSPDVDIAVPNGTYTLQLLLYEGWRSRAADIVIEGKTVRAAYDMFKEQGGNFNQGSVLQHSFTLTDGNIDIQIKGPLHLGGLILSKGKGDGTVLAAILKSKSDLDFKDVLKAINFGDTRNLSIGNVNFTAAAVNTSVDGVTNKAAGDVYAGEHNQKLPLKLHK
ncbi:c-type cytochrome, partial [Verrucomicrobia bacterium]|nr:c-type cytochrome [Verrucomicrobiota bacterium]